MAGGGAWKVAYADFITAMMALFMVLWILGAEEDLLEQLQEYFRNPPSPWDSKSGKFPVESGEYSGHTSAENKEVYFDSMNPTVLEGLVEEFYKVLDIKTNSEEVPPIEITVTSDGIRMVIFDRKDTRLFNDAEANLSEWGLFLMQNLAWLLSRYPFHVVIESHSGELDALHEDAWNAEYGTWELTTDRANEVRRNLQFYANGGLEIKRVSGYGDTKPLDGDTSNGRTHQRVNLSLSLAPHSESHISKASPLELADASDEDDE